MNSKLKIGGIILLFFVVTFGVFNIAFRSEFVTWDDMGLVSENPDVKAMNPMTLKHVFTKYDPELYIPLTFVSYQMDNIVCGGGSECVHFINLTLHTINALLVMWLLYLLIGNGWIALALGLVFAVHPLNTEAAMWASARKDTLSTAFFLSSLISYLQYRSSGSRKIFWLSVGLFMLSLLSKVMAVTLPVVLVFVDLMENRRDWKEMAIEKAPFFLLSILFGVIGLFGKEEIVVASTLTQKILMAAKSSVFYVEKFFIPADLSVMYPYTKEISLSSPDFFVPVLVCSALVILMMWSVRKHPWISFGIAFFFLTLAPTFINFAKGGDVYFASDRYAYIPIIGLLFLIGCAVAKWWERERRHAELKRDRAIVFGTSGVILIGFCMFASAQAQTWRTSTDLYLHTLELYPNARAAHNNLGMEYLKSGRTDLALKSFDESLAVKDDPRTRVNKGAALVQKNDLDAAEAQYQKAIMQNAELPDTYYGLGNIERKRGNLVEAVRQYSKSLEVDPSYTNSLNNLGATYIELHDWDHAIDAFQKSIVLNPFFIEAYYNLAGSYEQKGMFAEAKVAYEKAIELNPQDLDALANLATVLYKLGDIDGAAKLLQKVLALNSSHPTAVSLVMQMKRDGVAE